MRLVADTAAAVIKRVAPDLSWVYLEYTDDMGHTLWEQQTIGRCSDDNG